VRRHRWLGIVDSLGEIVVVGVEAFDDEAGELLVAKRPTNRGERVRQHLHLVEVGRSGGVQLLDVGEFAAKGHRAGGRDLGKSVLQGRPGVHGGGCEETKASDPVAEGTLDGREDRLVLLHPHTVFRVDGRAMDGRDDLRRTQ